MSAPLSPPEPLKPDAVKALQTSAPAAAQLMKMLASEQRLKLLCRLGKGEASAGELADCAGLAQSAASQHLAKLRDVGIVATRRDAQTIYYRLADDRVFRVIGLLCELYR
jgi:ArsR family transcriptional regulator, virulence genes transcriptional regulator